MFQLSFGITNKQPALYKENINRNNNNLSSIQTLSMIKSEVYDIQIKKK